jgi:hypothetical protein
MYCVVVLPFLVPYLPTIWSVVDMLLLNPHYGSQIISSIHGVKLQGNILEKIYRKLIMIFLFIGIIIDSFHCRGHSSVFRIKLITLRISKHNVLPPTWITYTGICSTPHDVYHINFLMAISVYLSMALQHFIGPWPLFQFLNPIHSR